ncbi:hypothetical protein O3M35_005454 [Rhynocoris fuscipes]|uniref:Rad21/Rec8-like protein N-terminal domain-containing protein n=1 Tax=Rhynocoris fuscipes TaxID=488301 RepID=A0AAW1DK64_9HEMI
MDYLLNADLEDVLIAVKKEALKIERETKVKQREKGINLKNVIYLTKAHISKLPEASAMLGTKERLKIYNLRLIFIGMYILFDKNLKNFFKLYEKLIINKENNLCKKEMKTKKDVISLSDSLMKVTMPAKKKRKNLCIQNAQEEDINVTISSNQLRGIIQLENSVNSSLIEEVPKSSIDNERDSFLFSPLNEKSERASSIGNELRMQSAASDEIGTLINKVSLPSASDIQVDELMRNMIPEELPRPQELNTFERDPPVEPIAHSVPYIDEISDLSTPRKRNIPEAKIIKNIFKQASFYTYEQVNKRLNVENRYKQINFHQILSQIPSDDNTFLNDEFNVGLKSLAFSFIVYEEEDIDDISENIVKIREESNISTISAIEFANNLVEPSIISERGLNNAKFPENNLIEMNNGQPVPAQLTISDKADNVAQDSLVDKSLKTNTSQGKTTPEKIDKIPRKLTRNSKEVQEITTEASNKNLCAEESRFELLIPSSDIEFRQNIMNNIEELWQENDTIKFTDICSKGQSKLMAAKVFNSLIGLHSLQKIFLRQESTDPDDIFICKTQQTFPE